MSLIYLNRLSKGPHTYGHFHWLIFILPKVSGELAGRAVSSALAGSQQIFQDQPVPGESFQGFEPGKGSSASFDTRMSPHDKSQRSRIFSDVAFVPPLAARQVNP